MNHYNICEQLMLQMAIQVVQENIFNNGTAHLANNLGLLHGMDIRDLCLNKDLYQQFCLFILAMYDEL